MHKTRFVSLDVVLDPEWADGFQARLDERGGPPGGRSDRRCRSFMTPTKATAVVIQRFASEDDT